MLLDENALLGKADPVHIPTKISSVDRFIKMYAFSFLTARQSFRYNAIVNVIPLGFQGIPFFDCSFLGQSCLAGRIAFTRISSPLHGDEMRVKSPLHTK